MLDDLRTTLRGKFMVVTTAFGNYKTGKEILERGTNEWQRDSALIETVQHRESDDFVGFLLEKGTSESARDHALYKCVTGLESLAKVKMLLEHGTSERGRDLALSQVAVHCSEAGEEHDKIKVLTRAGVSPDGMKKAIGRAAGAGNVGALNFLLFLADKLGPNISQIIENDAVSNLRRRDLTIGVERLLSERNLLPKP